MFLYELKCSLLIFLIVVFFIQRLRAEDPVVDLKYGKVKGFGIKLDDGSGGGAEIFLKIPFAKPPIGDLRFEKPQPPDPWTTPIEAKDFGLACVPSYLGVNTSLNSEDCLHLNVFRPAKKAPADGFPVLLWVHGGGYVIGDVKSFGYQNLSNNFVSKDIIVVTVQYRLGPFGWGSLGNEELPGNLGYWDMTEALKFLNENIDKFGGNPKKITAWGLSSGAGSVASLTLSPHSRDFISQSIEQSGSVFASWSANDEVVNSTNDLVQAIGCSTKDYKLIKACLKKKSLDEFYTALEKTGLTQSTSINVIKYQPRIDNDFFPKEFAELFKESPKKPTIQGVNTHEALFYAYFAHLFSKFAPFDISQYLETFSRDNFTNFIRTVIAPESYFGLLAKQAQEDLIQHYSYGNSSIKNSSFWVAQYVQIISDLMFNLPNLWAAKHKLANNWPTFMYLDEHYNKKLFDKIKNPPVKGTFHTNEYPYMFGVFLFETFQMDDIEKGMQKAIVDTIVTFVKNGYPSLPSVKWFPLDQAHPYSYLSLKPPPEFHNASLMVDSLNFWDNIMTRYPFDLVRHSKTKIY